MQALYRRFEVLIREVAKFGIVGVVNTVLDIAVFNALHFQAGIGPLTSKTLSTAVAATSSYFMNRHWSFRHRGRTTFRREYTLFFVLNAVGLAIALAILAATRYGFGLTGPLALNVANIGGIGFGTLFRFYAYKRWVFPAVPDDGPTPAEAAISTTV